MARIHVMSEHLSNMIAAGEVVERPAGIVKECIENSIDAKATVIEVEAFQGGIERLIITDDGCGMDFEDAKTAFLRHATSKMQSEEDLFNIQTMGFRGEALPSIAAVSHVEMQTSNGDQQTLIRYHYGENTVHEPTSCPRGTRIDVSGLFMKTPARFKHLKSPSYEFSVIADLVNKMALSHPDIRFKLSHDGKVVFQTSGNGNILEILYQMYGKEVAQNAIFYDQEDEDFHIHGYAIQPKISRATKYFMFITLNGRLIRSVPIQNAIIEAYSSYMPPNRYPICVLQIETDAQLVDVNVHPNKWEVRLSKQNTVLQLIRDTIQAALKKQLETVAIKPKPKPVIVEQPKLDLNYSYPVRPKPNPILEKNFVKEEPIVYEQKVEVKEEPKPEPIVEPVVEAKKGDAFFDEMIVLAQLHDSYILCENPQGLVIIDQHAAQERYHYEQLQKSLSQPTTQTQPLMVPISLDVSSSILSQVLSINEQTRFFGIEFDIFGNDQLIVRQVPLWMQTINAHDFLMDLLDLFEQNQTVDMAKLRKHMLATMACHSSIRFNRPLSKQEMEQVIRDLQKCEQPYHCPHGRPTVIVMSDSDLRKEFERG